MIVADTGAVLALIDVDDPHHDALKGAWETAPERWVLPWAILPELDYLLATQLGTRAEETFLEDLAAGAWNVEWGLAEDLPSARKIAAKYRGLKIGLVDAVVVAVARRLRAEAIATLDLRHFGPVVGPSGPRLIPRDL